MMPYMNRDSQMLGLESRASNDEESLREMGHIPDDKT